MISWKYSFEKISKDLELARKKKQALDDLFNSGKISALTHESLDRELTGTISEIEARQKDLANKMTSKIADLEKEIGTLEMFLANSEIQYAAGEIDEELHATESSAFSLGLDAVKRQLATIKEVVTSLMPEVAAPPPPSPTETEETPSGEVVEETTEIPAEETIEVETSSGEATIEEPSETPAEELFPEVEASSGEATIGEPSETPAEEMFPEVEATTETIEVSPTEEAVETLPETVEMLEEEAPSEEVFEEPAMTEIPVEVNEEPLNEEAMVEEETNHLEEESSYEEEEATSEEAYEN